MITIAMPVWNSREIVWLAMESFCRQETRLPWELIVYEEKHREACGRDYFKSYVSRLNKTGCVGFSYITQDGKLALSEKWAALGRKADPRSKMFCACDADNYYQKYMVNDAYTAYIEGYDFLTDKRGYAYDINTKVFVEYKKPEGNTGFQMCYSTDLVRKLPRVKQHKLLNTWIYSNARPKKAKVLNQHLTNLITNGHNNISGHRGRMMAKFEHPFYETDKKLTDILPADVAKRLMLM